jgi:hypothetical protein
MRQFGWRPRLQGARQILAAGIVARLSHLFEKGLASIQALAEAAPL